MLTTTFKLLHDAGACTEGYQKLGRALGGITKYGRNTPIAIAKIVETNGFDDALWSTRAVPTDQEAERDRLLRLFAADCAERVLPLYEARRSDDRRPREAIEVARRYARGEASDAELAAAWAAAWAAAGAAAWDAGAAARAAAGAAWAAARAAAGAAAWAAGAAARAAERAWQTARFVAYLKGEV